MYRPSVRRIARVRLFMEFVTEAFREIESAREAAASCSGPRPAWLKRPYGHASASARRGA